MPGKLIVVAGGQFGSEAKGHVAGRLAMDEAQLGNQVVAVRVAGPNAGHTAYDADGKAWALRCIPVMAVTNPDATLVIAAGSEIDMEVLHDEVTALEDGGIKVTNRLFVDAQATMLSPDHIEEETSGGIQARLGSTSKGIGAARSARINRTADLWERWPMLDGYDLGAYDTSALIKARMQLDDATCIIEGTQGYGLGLHAGFYPFCTSSDCRAIDFCAMAGINPWDDCVRFFEPWVVLRTFPIRVAGNSGPMYREVTWEDLAERTGGYIKPERTTVTKKIRRIGEYDESLARAAVKANGGSMVKIALTFMDYIDHENADTQEPTPRMLNFMEHVEEGTGASVKMLTTGANTSVLV